MTAAIDNSMAAASFPLELTVIVAATARNMGIGAAGGLPWTGLRKEMAYFARVTKRGSSNAVVMGRRTWESIPPKFRPLRGRVNVVVSRSFAPGMPREPEGGSDAGPVEAASLDMALAYLSARVGPSAAATATAAASPNPSASRVFVIGGAQIYAAAMVRPETRRVLLTRVHSDFACDTFFPLPLGQDGVSLDGPPAGETTAPAAAPGAAQWAKSSREAHAQWIGEDLPVGVQTENGTDYEFEMWEKVDLPEGKQ